MTKIWSLILSLFITLSVFGQTTIHCWDFNSGSTTVSGSKWTSPISTLARVTGNGSITHNFTDSESFAGTTDNSCVGSASGSSLVLRDALNNGNNVTAEFSTLGFENIELSFASRRTATGFDSVIVSYSTNGGSAFTTLDYFSPSSSGFNTHSFNFTNTANVNDNDSLQVRFTFYGATTASGNARIDNLKLQGDPDTIVPVLPVVINQYPISSLKSVDSNGVADSLNVNCAIQGIVSGGNLRSNGVEFWLIDSVNSAGLLVRQIGFTGYAPQEGDFIKVFGAVSQFRGLIQFTVDSIQVISTGYTLPNPVLVTDLNESTEGRLVRINGLSMVSPSQWTGSGSGFNIDVTNGSNLFLARVVSAITLYNDPAPTTPFDLIGHGGQFSSNVSGPFNDGYQLLPRYSEDLIPDTTSPVLPVVINQYPIASLRSVNSDGVADSLGVSCSIVGIVSGGNLLNNGSQFWFIDSTNTAGLLVRQPGFTSYSPNEGDVLEIFGNVSQFRGLIQFSIDSLNVLSTGFNLPPAALVTELNESTEGRLIEIRGLNLVDVTQWTGMGTGFNVDVTNGTDTFLLRVVQPTTLYNDSVPNQSFNLRGHGSQFTTSTPALNGYQIQPRYSEDLIFNMSTDALLREVRVNVYPNPSHQFVTFELSYPDPATMVVYNTFGQVIEQSIVNKGKITINTNQWRSGIYISKINQGDNSISVRFIVQ
jgi:hypothetical protein